MPRNNMPDNWIPPAPAWQSDWTASDDPLVSAYFAVQGDNKTHIETWIDQAFNAANGPVSNERASFTDANGCINYVYIAYFRASAYKLWWENPCVCAWWQSKQRLEESVGYWREVFAMPFDRFETLHSSENAHGVGALSPDLQGPIEEHGYAGGMRDRIAASDSENLEQTHSISAKVVCTRSDNGRRVKLTPPSNTCVIRSGQNWSASGDTERDYYLKKIQPVLKRGMQFLSQNPLETNCYSMRLMDVKSDKWENLEQTFGLGYATDVYAFENWAKSHPTHVAIFDQFMQMVQCFAPDMKLQLWHEVTCIPTDGGDFEYICCNTNTGLLGYVEPLS